MKRFSAAPASCSLATRKSIDLANQDGGFQRENDTKASSTRRAGVRFEDNSDKRVENEVGDETQNAFLLAEDSNANFKSLDTNPLQVSFQSEDGGLKTTDAEYTTLNESCDSAL